MLAHLALAWFRVRIHALNAGFVITATTRKLHRFAINGLVPRRRVRRRVRHKSVILGLSNQSLAWLALIFLNGQNLHGNSAKITVWTHFSASRGFSNLQQSFWR